MCPHHPIFIFWQARKKWQGKEANLHSTVSPEVPHKTGWRLIGTDEAEARAERRGYGHRKAGLSRNGAGFRTWLESQETQIHKM